MPIFIKLLATNIVASNFFGRSNNLETISKGFEFSSSPLSISVLESENNATSTPDIRAEQINNTNNNVKPSTAEILIADSNNKLSGSGSNYIHIS